MKFQYLFLSLLGALLISSCSESNSEKEHSVLDINSKNIVSSKSDNTKKSVYSDFTYLLEKVGPSVVSVDSYYVNKFREDIFEDEDAPNSEESNGGSGIILDKDGYIITNVHVIEGSNAIKVTLMDKRVFMAKVVGIDSISDLALLKIEADNLVPIKVGDVKKVKVGQWVAALGAPFGFQFSLTSGIVSAKKRTIQDDPSYIPFLQTDAAINQGNSGGPLLNLDGEVIGVNSQIYSRSGGFVGIAFAIPIDIVINVANQLKTTGKVERGQLGVKVDGMSYELAKTFGRNNSDGALILDVLDGNGIEEKLQVGDIILAVNGETIKGPEDLPGILNLIKPGEEIELYIWREEHGLKVTITLQPRGDLNKIKGDIIKSNEKNNLKNTEIYAIEGLDVGLKKPNQDILSYYKLDSGLQIASIGNKAESLGFALGDIIVRVGAYDIKNADDLEVALRNQKNVPIFLIRNYKPIFIPYAGELAEGS
ncbi:PDZ domain-containing protein [Neisseriaceae bacterium PsAf]|nr:PDZ domain-containing protein [Neisseriaceae bacterium PsAf]